MDKLNLVMQNTSLEEINPTLTKCLHLESSQIVGFDIDTGLTKQRQVVEYELVYFTQNGGYSVINGKKFSIVKGSLRFHRPGDVVHSSRYGEIFILHFSLSPNSSNTTICQDLDCINPFMMAIDPERICSLYENLIIANITANLCLVKKYLWEIINYLFDNKQKLEIRLDNRKELCTKILTTYIDSNYDEQISLQSLSKIVHLHPNYLHRVFKRDTGKTPLQYLTDVRLKKAYEFILLSDRKISDICSMCGFNSESYFIAVFKRKYGITPNELRQQEINSIKDFL